MIIIFIILQIILLLIMLLHDWLNIPPFTDIKALKQQHNFSSRVIQTIINTLTVAIPLALTIHYYPGPFSRSVAITLLFFYGLLTIGTICTWWIPYLFGSPAWHKAGFVEYKNTHSFLPARGDNVVPNTLHVVLHIFAWSCFAYSLYYFFTLN